MSSVPEETIKRAVEKDECKCGNPAEGLHICPLAADIFNDAESLCNCCPECVDECRLDI